ncbi:hypothetical protein [Lacrimispora sp.]|uniref:hypothetical protein n=1 Tax=Lacrimispora sp. TaxID=2719234 RepID=UPI0039928E77
MICFTEQEKDIGRAALLVIEFNEAVKRVFEFLKDMLMQLADRISKSLQVIHREYKNLPPKEKYKAVRRLNKCGFTEKEINLMVCGTFHCRNNC